MDDPLPKGEFHLSQAERIQLLHELVLADAESPRERVLRRVEQ